MTTRLSDLREALEQPISKPSYWPSETMEDYDDRLIEWLKARDVERDAARRFLALTETGERLAAAIDEMDADTINQTETDLRSDDLFYKWDELIHVAIEIRTALADYLTEEET